VIRWIKRKYLRRRGHTDIGVIGWLSLAATFVFGMAVDNSGSTPPPSSPIAIVDDGGHVHFSYTEVAAWLTVVGGAAIGLVVIGYDRIGRMRIAILRANDEARRDTLSGQLETAQATIKELEDDLTRLTAARDSDNQRASAEIARLAEDRTMLFRIVETAALANTLQPKHVQEVPKHDEDATLGSPG
jgi:hypothetical protein